MKEISAGILGLGMCAPEKVVTNFDLEKVMDTSDEWIRTRTGIEERRYAQEDQATSDLAVEAAKNAIADAGIDKSEIELIILATCTPDHLLQGTACIVQEKLGLKGIPAFDLNAACSGFVYALTTAKSFIQSKMYKKILVIGAETLTRMVDMKNRNTAVLFGDGAGAAIIGEVEEGHGIISSFLAAEGEDKGILRTPAGGSKIPITKEIIDKGENFLVMNGQEVFKFAVKALPKATEIALEKADLEPKDLTLVVPHQANKRIIDAAAKRLDLPYEKFYINLNKYGNTSSASIGLALKEAVNNGRVKKGDYIALTGFGAGLTYASLILRWSK